MVAARASLRDGLLALRERLRLHDIPRTNTPANHAAIVAAVGKWLRNAGGALGLLSSLETLAWPVSCVREYSEVINPVIHVGINTIYGIQCF